MPFSLMDDTELAAMPPIRRRGRPPRPIRSEARLSEAAEALRHAEAELLAAVIEARRLGDTWNTIGMALGITRQAAVKRFGQQCFSDGSETHVVGLTLDEKKLDRQPGCARRELRAQKQEQNDGSGTPGER